MKKSYTSNYLKIYLWQGLSFASKFLSLFIVTPYLTSDKPIYGIFAVCVSVTIFLSYSDLGFMMAGQKYAAECYAKGDRTEEMEYIGFGTFISLIFVLLCSVMFFYLGLHPDILIKGLDTQLKIYTASRLLLILAIFTPVTVFQKMASTIFDVRLDSYISQRILLGSSFITILSVFYFFRGGKYGIVSYFLFSQVINFIACFTCLFVAKIKYNYDIKLLFKHLHFNPAIYKKANKLAYSGLYIMVAWVLFYELDQITIGKFLGIEKVAVYAIAFFLMSFFRTIFGILFSPFSTRVNHFIGEGNIKGLKVFCTQWIILAAPVVFIPVLIFVLVAKYFIISWVGIKYTDSVIIARFLSLCWIFSSISYVMGIVLVAQERIKEMYLIATIQPIVYWSGVILVYPFIGLTAFAVFKFIATIISQTYYFFVLLKFLDISFGRFLKKIISPMIFPIVFIVMAIIIANNYLPYEKSKINLILVVGTTGLIVFFTFIIQYITSSEIRNIIKNIYINVFKKRAEN